MKITDDRVRPENHKVYHSRYVLPGSIQSHIAQLTGVSNVLTDDKYAVCVIKAVMYDWAEIEPAIVKVINSFEAAQEKDLPK